MKKGENQKAISLLEEILPNIESEGSANLYLKTVNYLLITSLKMDDEARINKYLAKGEKIASNMHIMGVVAMSLMSAMIDAKIRKGDYSDALQTLEQVDTATLVNGLYPRDLYLKHKANCMSGLGDYRQAYLLQCEADSFSEKIRGIEAQKQLSELYGKLKVQEREVKIARLSKEVAQRQLLIVIFATGFVILALLGIAYFFWRRRREEQLQAQRYVEGLERERARFARELHDGACNELLGIGMTINTRMAEPDEVANRIRQLRDTLRNISHELMPPQFDKATLDDILGYYLQHIKSPNLDVQFSAQGDFSKLPKQVAYEFYRIVQETLGNTISHASATLAKVEIKCDSNEVTMSVSDNGHVVADGNGEGRRGNSPTGIGLQSIKDRVKSINADLNVEVGEQGTVVSIKKLL